MMSLKKSEKKVIKHTHRTQHRVKEYFYNAKQMMKRKKTPVAPAAAATNTHKYLSNYFLLAFDLFFLRLMNSRCHSFSLSHFVFVCVQISNIKNVCTVYKIPKI